LLLEYQWLSVIAGFLFQRILPRKRINRYTKQFAEFADHRE
jgi:hypothetical protein